MRVAGRVRVAKKKEILKAEVVKLEACLRKRTELLQRLRQSHEKLLTANGHLQCVVVYCWAGSSFL